MNRWNKYTQRLNYEGHTILFQIETDEVLLLTEELSKLVQKYSNNPDGIADVHPELFKKLCDGKFLVGSDVDEAELLIDSWKKADNDPKSFSVIINPTLNCNLRCWYCYEHHQKDSRMSDETVRLVHKLLNNKCSSPDLGTLNISFFGGEPLLYFNEIVFPLLEYASDLCEKHRKKLSIAFTTNSTLLTSAMLDKLDSLKLCEKPYFQITLDGNEFFHDKTRISHTFPHTYKTILHNIQMLLAREYKVNMRLNYTGDNIYSFLDVLTDLNDVEKDNRDALQVNLQQVWQDGNKNPQAKQQAEDIAGIFRDNGFHASSDTIYTRNNCYADKANSIVINYDGNIFKCTAREFNEKNREGVLNADGNIVWNDRYAKRMQMVYSNPICKACEILPLCNGGCSQSKLESNRIGCLEGYSQDDKKAVVEGRLFEILNK